MNENYNEKSKLVKSSKAGSKFKCKHLKSLSNSRLKNADRDRDRDAQYIIQNVGSFNDNEHAEADQLLRPTHRDPIGQNSATPYDVYQHQHQNQPKNVNFDNFDLNSDETIEKFYKKYWNSSDQLLLNSNPALYLNQKPNHSHLQSNSSSSPTSNNNCKSTTNLFGTATDGAAAIGNKRRATQKRCVFLLLFMFLLFLLLNSLVGQWFARSTTGGAGAVNRAQASVSADGDDQSSTTTTGPPLERLSARRLPHCIIIGARKCGTRALLDMLNLHPQVEKAPMEVHFFDRDDNYSKGLDWYRRFMPETTPDQFSIEKSPSYFVTPEVPERIHGMNSSIKLLLIVREPVTRVISDYTQIYHGNNSNPPSAEHSNKSASSPPPPPRLQDLLFDSNGSINIQYKALRISLYSRYLQRWLDVFPLAQIHVVDGEALIRDPYSVLVNVEAFLGLPHRLQPSNFYFNSTKGFYCWKKLVEEQPASSGGNMSTLGTANSGTGPISTTTVTTLHCLNESKGRPHPAVDKSIITKLRKFYQPHNLNFYEMVGRDFGWPEE